MHAQKSGDHIDVLDVETGQLIVDLYQYILDAAELSVRGRIRHCDVLLIYFFQAYVHP